MRKIWACLAAALLAALMAAPAGATGWAAPTYVSSTPAAEEELHQAPDQVEVTFSEPLDTTSKLVVRDTCGRRLDDGKITVEGTSMSVAIDRKPSGFYRVAYEATGLAGLTGTTSGKFRFFVHPGKACDAAGGKGTMPAGMGKGHEMSGESNDSGGGTPTHMQDAGGMTMPAAAPMPADMTMPPAAPMTADMAAMDTSEMSGGDMPMAKHDNGGGERKVDHAEMTMAQDDPSALLAGSGAPAVPDGSAVAMALGFSVALGIVGGWALRLSAAR